MRKWLILVYSIAFLSLCGIIILSLLRSSDELLYTIPQIKSFTNNNEKIKLEIYSNKPKSSIKYVENNLYNLILDDQEVILNDVEIEQIECNGYYLYIIKALNFNKDNETLISKKCILEIINQKGKYTFNIGSLSILSTEGYELIGVDDFYASYSYIDGNLFLVGVNIELSNSFKALNEMKIGSFTSSINSLIQHNKKYPNEMNIISSIPSYNAISRINNENVAISSNIMFIPISYTYKLYMLKEGYITFKIDDKAYYLDTFSFIANELDMNQYKTLLKEGEYASN